MTIKPRYKSEALESIHSSAAGLFNIGSISSERMRQFDEICLESPSGDPEHQAAMSILLTRVELILQESTHPDATNFDAKAWLENWVKQPAPALGGARPVEFLGTPDGVDQVERVLGAMQSGSYL